MITRRQSSGPVAWFSCGAASACVAKFAAEEFGDELTVAYCDTMASEHPDNQRFFDDVAEWIGLPIVKLKSTRYDSIDDVFERTRYMSGIAGARCTVEMKKRVRFDWQHADDLHLFGLTTDEQPRIARFILINPELKTRWILSERNLDKNDCLQMVANAGIKLPAMYDLGFKNNNCIGCVKAASPAYWNRIRTHFPDTFSRRVAQSEAIGVKLLKHGDDRLPLSSLDPASDDWTGDEDLSCGPQCSAPQGDQLDLFTHHSKRRIK